MKKIDIFLALISGLGLSFLARGFLEGFLFYKKIEIFIFLIFPLLSVFGLWVSFLLGKKFAIFFQGGKFLLTGILATLCDLVVFKGLRFFLPLSFGWLIASFKAVSFLVSTFFKYWLNKFWAFEKKEKVGMGKEILKFYLVTILGMVFNVTIFYFFFALVGPLFNVPLTLWETISVILAAIAVAAWNFLGYKIFVFEQ